MVSFARHKLILAALALLAGGLVYIVFRADSLIMFSWFDALGMSESIDFIRENYSSISIYSWVKYNMPAALWLFAYMFVIDAIWNNQHNGRMYHYFLWLMPVIAVVSEFAQLLGILPGTFDFIDVISYISAVIIYLLITKTR